MTCFAALGLTDTATVSEVRFAYHAKARELHPDLGGDPDKFDVLRKHYSEALQKIAERKCATCNGTRKVTHTVGWSSVESRCPTCS